MLLVIPGLTDVAAIDHIARWLLTPISGSNEHIIATSTAWHGRLMVLGMGLLTPPLDYRGALFQNHAATGLAAPTRQSILVRDPSALGSCDRIVASPPAWPCALAAAGLAATVVIVLHGGLGWALLLGAVQIVGAWLRGTHGGPVDPFTRQPRPPHDWPGDHFSMTPRRIVFEYVHKWAGYALAGADGVGDIDGPDRRRRAALDANRHGRLVAFHAGRFYLVAARRPLHRHVSGDLGPRSEASGQSPASDRFWHRAQKLTNSRAMERKLGGDIKSFLKGSQEERLGIWSKEKSAS